MDLRIDVEGLDELKALYEQLPARAQQRVLRPAFRAAMRQIVLSLRQFAQPHSRRVARAATIASARPDGAEGEFGSAFWIGFRRKAGGGGRLAHLVDKGTARRRTRSGANRGAMPATPFFQAAIRAALASASLTLSVAWAQKLAIEAERFARGKLDLKGRIRK